VSLTVETMRQDAVAAFEAAVAAAKPARLIPRTVRIDAGRVTVHGEPLPEVRGRRVVAALGKAAPGLADAWLQVLPGWADELLVLTPHGVPVSDRVASSCEVLHGAHPYPDAAAEAAARRILEVAAGLGEDDLLLVLLSGGASALLAAPEPGLSLDDIRTTTELLLRSGASIQQVNMVRRQLLAAAGGGLGRTAAPARVVTLVLSDVVGDPLPDIASGPTVQSPTTAADALGVLGGLGLVGDVPPPVIEHLRSRVEASVDDSWASRCRTEILANNRTAVDAAASLLAERGYETIIHPGFLEGEARHRGETLARFAEAFRSPAPVAFVAGGETTVTVRGSGIGGRNHELALAAALELSGRRRCVMLAAGTDGVDGLTAGAGAVVDPTTQGRLKAAGVDAAAALDDNDSGPALSASGDSIRTGPTGTNVCDVLVVLSG
jgi:hydroxypyruvate reductase